MDNPEPTIDDMVQETRKTYGRPRVVGTDLMGFDIGKAGVSIVTYVRLVVSVAEKVGTMIPAGNGDEGGPLGSAIRSLIPSHRELLRSEAVSTVTQRRLDRRYSTSRS